jgi:hypothetical protein
MKKKKYILTTDFVYGGEVNFKKLVWFILMGILKGNKIMILRSMLPLKLHASR